MRRLRRRWSLSSLTLHQARPSATDHSMAKTHKKRSNASPAPAEVDDEGVRGTTGMRPDEMPADVLEFITAVDDYKRIHRRPFPTWSEVLEILKGLGYSRSR